MTSFTPASGTIQASSLEAAAIVASQLLQDLEESTVDSPNNIAVNYFTGDSVVQIQWVKKFSKSVRNSESFVIPNTFESEYLLVLAKCLNCRATWHKAGYLSHLIDVFPVGKTQIKDKKLILLNKPIIQSFSLFHLGYKLEFEFAEWINELILEIYEPNMPLFSNNPQSGYSGDMTGQSIPVSVSLTATAASVMAANANRKGLVIRNKGNKTAYLGFTNTIDDDNAPYAIPGGWTLEEMNDFPPGELFMIAPNGNTDVVVMEMF
jgi:hypothetical protein